MGAEFIDLSAGVNRLIHNFNYFFVTAYKNHFIGIY